MLIVDNLQAFNFENALRGMRNPMNSWEKSDSYTDPETREFHVGVQDLKLMKRLVKAGTDHRKFMRQIMVSADITAPLYWWKQFDTYKVGTVSNSCSTMHKITAKPLELSDFSQDILDSNGKKMLQGMIDFLNDEMETFKKEKGQEHWLNIIGLLPECYNQTRMITLNYEVLINIYFSRKSHKLSEWHTLCDEILSGLPYFAELVEGLKK